MKNRYIAHNKDCCDQYALFNYFVLYFNYYIVHLKIDFDFDIVGLSGPQSDGYPTDYLFSISGMLQEFEFIALPLAVSSSRASALDVTAPLQVEVHSIAYPYPTYDADMTGFIKPFSPMVSHM